MSGDLSGDGRRDRSGANHRVLMTADTVGGVWQFALELARGLIRHGDEVVLATMGGPLSRDQLRDARMPGLTLHASEFRLAWMGSPWRDVERAGEWLESLASQVQPDIVHLNDYSHGCLEWNAPVLMTGHSCVLSWWQAVHGVSAPVPEWAPYRVAVRSGLQGADLVVAPTRAMLEALWRHYGPLDEAGVIFNGRTPLASPTAGARDPVILAAGRLWDAGKNITALADIAPRLPWTVAVAGEHRHPDGGDVQLPNVRLLGRLSSEQLAPWFARASIYALPARYEPFGLSALEAAQAGCALVLGDIDSLREVWGDAALFVDPDDSAALEDALQRLIADPALRQDYARRACLRAARYSSGSMVDAYRRAYAGLICHRRRQEPMAANRMLAAIEARP